MGIRILTGRTIAGASPLRAAIYGEIGAALRRKHGRLFLIVPEQFTLGAEADLMAFLKLEGLMDVQVMSLGRLSTAVLSQVGGGNVPVLDEHGRKMLLARVLAESEGTLRVFGRSVKKVGFLDQVDRLIDELKEAGITPAQLEDALGALAEHRYLTQKTRDILSIYQSYEAMLGESQYDAAARKKAVYEKMISSDFFEDAEIWIDGFFTFSELDFLLVKGLMCKARSVTMTLDGDPDLMARDGDIFEICRDTIERVRDFAQEQGLSFKLQQMKMPEVPGALGCLARELFTYDPLPFDGCPAEVCFCRNRDPWAEASWAAVRILDYLREHPHRDFGDIAVLCGSPDQYGRTLARVFENYGIPVFQDVSLSLRHSHLIETLITLLKGASRHWSGNEVMSYAKSVFSPISPDAACLLENYALTHGISGGRWFRAIAIASDTEAEGAALEALEEARRSLMTPLEDLERALKKANTYDDFILVMVDFMQKTGMQQRWEDQISALVAAGEHEQAGGCRQIGNALMAHFDQIHAAMGPSTCSLKTLIRIMESGLRGRSIGILPQNRHAVSIIDPLRSRGGSLGFLLILGVNEGLLPRSDSDGRLLTDGDRLDLRKAGLALKNHGTFQQCSENYGIYSQVVRASDRIAVSWCLTNEKGESVLPSPLVGNFRRVFPEVPVIPDEASERFDWVSTGFAGREALLRHRSLGDDPALCEAVTHWFETQGDEGDMLKREAAALSYNGVTDVLPGELVGALWKQPLQVSVSRMEKFSGCPFAHFIQYGLRPEILKAFEPESQEIGSVIHDVLHRIFKASGGHPETLLTDERDQLIENALAAYFEGEKTRIFEGSGTARFMKRKIGRMTRRSVEAVTKHLLAGDYTFEASEKRFYEALMLPDGFPSVTLTGSIDRMDLYRLEDETFVKIIDYKTGDRSVHYGDIYLGVSMQLLVYLGVAMDEIAKADGIPVPAGVFYFKVDDPMMTKRLTPERLEVELNKVFRMEGLYNGEPAALAALDHFATKMSSDIFQIKAKEKRLERDEMMQVVRYARKVLERKVVEMLEGVTCISPVIRSDGSSSCDFCEYRDICQLEERLARQAARILKDMDREDFFDAIGEVCDHEVD